jgi:hypothetical protein
VQVFLSYRRSDVGGYAGRLADTLREHLDAEGVFQDVTAITLGQAFTAAIDRALTVCDAVLAVIGPSWLTASTSDGRQRLPDPDDYVRIELTRALQRNDLRVIAVLVGGAHLPAAEALPVELQGLVERQGIVLRDESWHQDVETLVRSLRGEPVLPTRRRRTWLVAGVAAIAVAALSGLAWWIWTPGEDNAGDPPATQLRELPESEKEAGYAVCPPPNGDGWRSIELADDPTGIVQVTEGPLTFTVKHARWRQHDSGTWEVFLDTEMENGTTTDFAHGSWMYNYLVVGQRQFVLNPTDGVKGCYSADPAFVKPELKGDARAGFTVNCSPEGAIELMVTDDSQRLVGDGARIMVTQDTEPGDC